MKFVAQYKREKDRDNWLDNGLTDGQLFLAYRDFPTTFESIAAGIAQKGIEAGDIMALETENTVPSALTLLYLLEAGHNVLLLPKRKQARPQPPVMCKWLLTTTNPTDDQMPEPNSFLHIRANINFTPPAQPFPYSSRSNLYLRTSGSTGTPKMAVHGLARLQGNIRNCVRRLQLGGSDRIALPVPIFHMFGLGAGFLPGVSVGANIDLQKDANLLRYLPRERAFNPNVAFMTPIFCESIIKGRRSARPYRFTVLAGDRIRGNTFDQYETLSGCLVQLYGSTELGAITAASPDDPGDIRAHTVGKPMSEVQMTLQNRRESADGESEEVGRLWCSHPFGFEGYVDESGAPIQAGAIPAELPAHLNWFYTKDLGRIRADQRVQVLGRADHSVNRDGMLVFFADVEKAISTMPNIETAVIVSYGESKRGKQLILFCLPREKTDLSTAAVKTHCFDILPRQAVPDIFIIIEQLPLLANGKIDRQELMRFAAREYHIN